MEKGLGDKKWQNSETNTWTTNRPGAGKKV